MSSKNLKMTATVREKAGKGAARAVRREKLVPAVIYGGNAEPVLISLDNIELTKALYSGTLFTQLCDMTVEGKEHLVLARDVQLHPVHDTAMHADFLRVTERTRIQVDVPVNFVDEDKSPGLSMENGVLNVISHTIAVVCRAMNIPENLTISLDGVGINENVGAKDLDLPEGVKLVIEDENFTIATVMKPRVVLVETPVESEDGEGEGAEGEAAEGGDASEGAGGEEGGE